jgi:hypothetical protein
MLEIVSNKPSQFNTYLVKKIKADLKKSAFFFNPTFLFNGKKYSIKRCIDSLQCKKNKIFFSELIPIKYLIYNNRQLYWVKIMKYYSDNLNREYLLFVGRVSNNKTWSKKLK